MEQKMKDALAEIVWGVTREKKAIMGIPFTTSDTIELVVDENVRITIQVNRIMITAESNTHNKGLGLDELRSDSDRCRAILPLSDHAKAVYIICNVQ